MNPEFNYKPTAPRRSRLNPRFARALPLVGLAVVVLAVAVFLLVSREDSDVADPGYTLRQTSLLGSKNFATLQDSDVYSYNGLAFYKTSLQGDGKLTVLRSGVKLPKLTDIVWGGSQGAVLSFGNTSFAGSAVEDAIRARKERLTATTRAYVWYLNYADGSLSLVSNKPLETDGTVYSPKDNGFYYAAYSDATGKASLFFFDVNTKTSSSIAPNDSFLVLNSLRLCSGYKVCFRVKDSGNSAHDRLYALDNNNALKEVFNSKGRLFATNDPNRYVVAEDNDSTDADQPSDLKSRSTEAHIDEDVDYPSAPAQLYDIQQKSTIDLGFDVDQSAFNFRIGSDNSFYVFDQDYTVKVDDQDVLAYRAGVISAEGEASSSLFPLLDSAGKSLEEQLVQFSHGTTATLVTDSGDKQHIFANVSGLPTLQAAGIAQAQQEVNKCKGNNVTSVTYDIEAKSFAVELVDDNNFEAKIAAFSTCVVQKGSTTLTGHNYKFSGLDPLNGRLSTD